MKIIGGYKEEIDIFPNPKYPENTVTFDTTLAMRHEKYCVAVICWTICRGAGMKLLALYRSYDFAKQVAKDLQQAYDSGEKEFTLPKENPPVGGERTKL